ncbi:nucleotidyltransferase [Bradyrhizobium liaoningense]|uniref:nucleotidyltransferase domain-containing protein n=1 Tax=Bradyrhizobium liaoningense TaxID=43992 RepID=UPI001BADA6FC|nr:nucleotidyltransferase [Bradyrhizobium liaoningense]MBR0842929.1 nucleotidyltransferase [Bradyrhizobium liaoningense]
MAISETQLETWGKQGPTAQFTATYETLRGVLNDPLSPYYLKSFEIFLQGSYKNTTNVYGDSDVDVVIRLDSIFYTDTYFLNDEEKRRYNSQRSAGTYTLDEFKAAVIAWLTKTYGNDVKPGKKAVFIKGNGTRRDADVLVCAKLRRYYTFPAYGDPLYVDGICFFLPEGTRIENFPEKHSANCTQKHQDTRQWFKHTVRIFKNLRNAMIEKKIVEDGLAPSYFIEGMLYNVPKERYGGSEQLNFKDVLNWLISADRDKFVCANEQFKLLGNGHVTWPAANCTRFLSAVKTYNDAA